MILRAIFRSCSTHHSKSSKALGSNSKFGTGSLKGNASSTLFGFEQAAFHRFASQQIGCFALRLDFAPEFDGHDNADAVPLCVRYILDFGGAHLYTLLFGLRG